MACNTGAFKQWRLSATYGIDGLRLLKDASIDHVDARHVLVKMHAASLNHLDLFVAKGGVPGLVESPGKEGLIVGTDGAGIVKAVGEGVTAFTAGDRVGTHLIPHLPDDTPISFGHVQKSVGMSTDGALTQYGLFHYTNLVHAPKSLGFEEAATMPCSGLTAYNALFGVRPVKAGAASKLCLSGQAS